MARGTQVLHKFKVYSNSMNKQLPNSKQSAQETKLSAYFTRM